MKYLFLLYAPEGPRPEPGTAEGAQLVAGYMAATGAMAEAGVLVDCAPLAPLESTTTVRVRDGEILLTDGPAAEIKEWLGGYTLVECADLDEALRWAATIPAAHDASIEIRPVIATERPG